MAGSVKLAMVEGNAAARVGREGREWRRGLRQQEGGGEDGGEGGSDEGCGLGGGGDSVGLKESPGGDGTTTYRAWGERACVSQVSKCMWVGLRG